MLVAAVAKEAVEAVVDTNAYDALTEEDATDADAATAGTKLMACAMADVNA